MMLPITKSLSRRSFLRASVHITSFALLAACTVPFTGNATQDNSANSAQPTAMPERTPAAGREVVIEVHYPYGGPTTATMNQIWDAYEQTHHNVGIKAIWAASDRATDETLFAAVAAGTPPDVAWVDGPQVAEWAERGALTDLSNYFAQAGLTETDFWAPSWQQNFYKGKSWAITFNADANFGFFWNKLVFEEAGLDPEKPPSTIDELTAYQRQIDQVNGSNIERMGILPWNTYGPAIAMFTWGWIFGGEFFDAQTNQVTANHAQNVAALQWMQALVKAMGGFERIASFQAGFGAGKNHPFFTGKQAMTLFGPWELANLVRYAPKLSYGVTFAPAGPAPAQPHSAWLGGWCMGIPQGAKQTAAAWDFVRWLCATDEGTSLYGKQMPQTPGYKKAKWYEELPSAQPALTPFLAILKEARHERPVMPVQDYYLSSLQQNVNAALKGTKPAEQALQDVTNETQKELKKIQQRGFSK